MVSAMTRMPYPYPPVYGGQPGYSLPPTQNPAAWGTPVLVPNTGPMPGYGQTQNFYGPPPFIQMPSRYYPLSSYPPSWNNASMAPGIHPASSTQNEQQPTQQTPKIPSEPLDPIQTKGSSEEASVEKSIPIKSTPPSEPPSVKAPTLSKSTPVSRTSVSTTPKPTKKTDLEAKEVLEEIPISDSKPVSKKIETSLTEESVLGKKIGKLVETSLTQFLEKNPSWKEKIKHIETLDFEHPEKILDQLGGLGLQDLGEFKSKIQGSWFLRHGLKWIEKPLLMAVPPELQPFAQKAIQWLKGS
ncbi:MAG: hypothetical protein K2X66_06750 [Cyanobacteria bacterium]|nr:hypothetical protein [Cyanobacteriota bacterium]